MCLRYIFALPASGKSVFSNGTCGTGFQGRHTIRQFLSGFWGPLSNARGRAAYWLNAALFLLIICFAVTVLYLIIGTTDSRDQPVISVDQKEVGESAQRYKIPMPAKNSAQVTTGLPSPSPAHQAPSEGNSKPPSEAIGEQAPTPLERSDNNGRPVTLAGTGDQKKILAPPQTGKPPVKEIEQDDLIATRVNVDSGRSADEKAGTEGIVSGPELTAKAEKESPQKRDETSPQVGSETGKRFFVKVQVANVRDEPSTKSRVKFRLEKGDSVTVTRKSGGWIAVKLDDGRFGWAHHTLLTDKIVTPRARATREIKAIRSEVAAKDIAKIIFELNGPFPPQTMIVEGEKPRVVCDFLDAGLAFHIGDSMEVHNGVVEKIRTGTHKWPKPKIRVVLDLVPERNYEVDQFFFEKENYYVLVVRARE